MSSTEGISPRQTWALRAPYLIALLCAGLAVSSMLRDSITFDETKHFASGLSHLKTGDHRMSPDTPPLAQMVMALPALLVPHEWPSVEAPGWRQGDIWIFGPHLLYELNDGHRWILPARGMALAMLVGLCFMVRSAAVSVFDSKAGLLSMYCACLCPSLLAHGRLVATDLPITVALFASILTVAQLIERISIARFLLATLSVSCACLTKFSWPLMVPGLFAMAAFSVLRPAPLSLRLPWKEGNVVLRSRGNKLAVVLFVSALGGLGVLASIWGCYGFRYAPYRGPDAASASMVAQSSAGRPAATEREQSWKMTLEDAKGKPLRGITAATVRWARAHRLLPEAYLFGLAFTLKTVQGQPTFLLGEVYEHGKWEYFPIAFFVKSPLALHALIVCAIAIFAFGRAPRCNQWTLVIGLVVFLVIYLVASMRSDMNLGQRHLLPIYPVVYVLVGNAARMHRGKVSRVCLLGVMAVLTFECLSAWPSYLGYYNRLVGGSARGHEYLLGSNIDWGQDLCRLRDYLDSRGDSPPIKFAYSGSADPRRYGIRCEVLPSHLAIQGPPAELVGGDYVVSLNQLHGLYTRQVRDSFWENPLNRQAYRDLHARFADGTAPVDESAEDRAKRAYALERFRLSQQWRLLNRLQRRRPDERIGWSMFVFHLTDDEIRKMLEPY